MKKILIAGCSQEVSSFNPVTCDNNFFNISTGNEIYKFNKGLNTYIGGVIEEIEKTQYIQPVFTYDAQGHAAGTLEHSSFLKISNELFKAIEEQKGKVDGVYLSLHGSMSTTEELDPEGFILEEIRKILGENIPIVISLDLHGVLTSKMLKNCNGVASLHTYPHIDFSDTGKRAFHILKKIITENVQPICARVKIPALVRGEELITENGLFGEQIKYAKSLLPNDKILSAGFFIGNPFTDVPELCSQSYVFTDNDKKLASQSALTMANDFWPNRSKMQAKLISIKKAVKLGATMDGTIAYTDAADAPSSGAQGDSNAIISEMLRQNYPHSILATVLDPKAAEAAHINGEGSIIEEPVGGAFDKKFKPLKLNCKVVSVSEKPFMLEKWGFMQTPGLSAVLKSGNLTIVVTSNPVMQVDRSIYLENNLNPKDFHSVIIKSPHCEPEFYDDWVEKNFNVDAPGSTSANLPSLGHKNCNRPMYPMEETTIFIPELEFFS
jgi:microcystin degradation protein MlrC